MGKLRALKLGIQKGVAHTVGSLNPVRGRFLDRIGYKLICTSCGHISDAHAVALPQYQGMEGKQLFELVAKTGSKGSGGFDECKFFVCNLCPSIIVRNALQCVCEHSEDCLGACTHER